LIRTLNKQLFSHPHLILPVLLFPSAAFLLFALIRHHPYSFFLAGGMVALAIYLSVLHLWLTRKRAALELSKQDFQEKANLLEDELAKDWALIESYCKKILNYSRLKGLTEKLCESFSLEDASAILSAEVNNIFGDQEVTVILYLFHARTGELGISASHKGQLRINIKEKKGDVYDQWMVKNLRPLLVEDTKNDFRFDSEKGVGDGPRPFRSLMSVPLMIGNKTHGILRVDSVEPARFTSDDIRLLATIGDVSAVAIENAELYENISDMAIHDSLTGLMLRRYLMERLSQEVNRHTRSARPFCFLMIDLDLFKSYNDQYGHPAGDMVLKTLGRILTETFKTPGDFLCRYGGEEFAVVLPDCSKEKGVALAEELRQKAASEGIVLRRQETHFTVSVGVATFPDDAQLKEEIVAKADFALYKAKNTGRNKVVAA